MKANILKKYRKHFALILLLSLNLCFKFTPGGISIEMRQAYATAPVWDTGDPNLDAFLGGDPPAGYYTFIGGAISNCPDCAYYLDIEEVVVYGTRMNNTPVNLATSDLWHNVPNNNQPNWNYWDYAGEAWQTSNNAPLPTPPSIAEAAVAQTLQYTGTGQFTRLSVRPVTPQTTKFDCSAWVYFVISKIDINVANSLCSSPGYVTTASIKSYIAHQGGSYHATPEIGDLAVWSGHVEFVVNYDGTHVTISGSRGADGSPVPRTTGEDYLTPDTMNQINTSGFLGFWTIQ